MKKYVFVVSLFILLISDTAFSQDQMFDICPLKVGESLPENVNLISSSGDTVHLQNAVSSKAIVVFYRGGWCPYCIRHLAALNEVRDDVKAMGYEMIAITPDQFDSLGVSEAKANSDITLFSDHDADVINAFGLGWQVGDDLHQKYVNAYDLDLTNWSGQEHRTLPVPAIYVIQNGLVQYQYVNPNYAERLKPATLMAVLKTL